MHLTTELETPAARARRGTTRRVAIAATVLGLGAALYLGRAPTLAESAPFVAGLVDPWRAAMGPLIRKAPAWLLGSGPDAAWSYALGALLSACVVGSPRASWWRAAGFLLAVGYELGQGAGVLRGTFDALDLGAIVVGYAAALSSSTTAIRIASSTSRISTRTYEDCHE